MATGMVKFYVSQKVLGVLVENSMKEIQREPNKEKKAIMQSVLDKFTVVQKGVVS